MSDRSRSASGSEHSRSRSPSRSRSISRSGSGSERSGSRSPSARSGSRTPSQKSGSPRSGSRSPSPKSGSRTPIPKSERSASSKGSARSGSGGSAKSGGSARSGSARSPSRSRSPSPRSGSRSPSPRSGSRSRTPSPRSGSQRSRSPSPKSGSGSRSASPKSGSRSPSPKNGSQRSSSPKSASQRSRSPSPKSGSPSPSPKSGSRSPSPKSGSRSPSPKSASQRSQSPKGGSQRSGSRSRSGSQRSASQKSESPKSSPSPSPSPKKSETEPKSSDVKSSPNSEPKPASDAAPKSGSPRSVSSKSSAKSDKKSDRSEKKSDKSSSAREPIKKDEESDRAMSGDEISYSDISENVEPLFSNPSKEWFANLPQPAARPRKWPITDPYLRALQENIDTISAHLVTIQDQEAKATEKFKQQLEQWRSRTQRKNDHEKKVTQATPPISDAQLEAARKDYLRTIEKLRRQRREYRGMLYDALFERDKLLRSGDWEKRHEVDLKEVAAELSPNRSVDWFLVFYFTLLVGVFLLWLIFVDYPENGQVATSDPTRNNDIFALRGSFRRADNIYTFYSNAALLVFLGFGLFWALPRRITWSALGINFMIGAYVMIVVILLNGFFLWASDHHFGKILITPTVMLDALYGAAACMIAYGAVVGQLDPIGILIFATIQVILYAINCYLSYGPIDAREFGRAGTVFTFGSCFGIATAWSISYWHPEAESVKEQKPSYFSSVMAFIGAVIIFICFPAFNTSLSIWWNVDGALNDGVLDGPFAGQQYRSLMNTISSEMGSAAAGFALSQIFRGKFRIPDLLRTVIAGGVAMSSAHNIIIQPWAAFIIGGISGVLCQVSLYWAQPFLLRVVRCNDVSHVFSTFFLPSALSALTGMIALGIYVDGDEADPTNFGGQPYAALFDRQETAIRNFGAWMLSIMFGLTAGLICGIFVNAIKKLSPPPAGNERLTDDIGWRVGVDE